MRAYRMQNFRYLGTKLFLLLLFLFNFGLTCERNDEPVIGVLSQSLDEPGFPSSANYIASSYVKFVEMFGARVVPILPNRPEVYYDFLLKRLNGVLLPGGEVSEYNDSYAYFSSKVFDYSKRVFDETGEIFPIWGTCLGLEELAILAADGRFVLSRTDSDNLLTPVELTDYGRNQSLILKNAPLWLLDRMENQSLAPNFHHWSLLSDTFDANDELQQMFNVVAYAFDRNGAKFVALMEGKRYPIWAVQYHPEMNLFEWSAQYNLAHNFTGCLASQYLADFFVQTARSSCQRFESETILSPFLIFHYNQTYTQTIFPDLDYTQMYIFDL